jgi:predicted nucleotidyltransferase component of viral defense system
LTQGQDAFLNAFFAVTDVFYLTGGTALAGFYLAHRTSIDLDLFTQSDEAFARLAVIMSDTAKRLSARIDAVRTTPHFKHYEAHLPDGPLTLHSARDIPVRLAPVRNCGGVQVDAIEDIMANKLCAMLGRSAMKDFVDLFFLHAAGFVIAEYLPKACAKDGGLAPENLAYAIDQLAVDAVPPYMVKPVTLDALRQFKMNTVNALVTMSFPHASP